MNKNHKISVLKVLLSSINNYSVILDELSDDEIDHIHNVVEGVYTYFNESIMRTYKQGE